MVQNFDDYSTPKGRLIIEDGVDLGEIDENWDLVLDLSQIWNENDLVSFNDNFYNYVVGNSEIISNKVTQEFYNELLVLVSELKNAQAFDPIYDKIYDLCDTNNVKIQTN